MQKPYALPNVVFMLILHQTWFFMHHLLHLFVAFSFLSILTSCQTLDRIYDFERAERQHTKSNQEIVNEAVVLQELSTDPKKKSSIPIQVPKSKPVNLVKIEERPEVDVWIRYFTGRGRKYMQLYLERSTRYLKLMQTVLRQEELPMNLIYIAMIESGFSPVAKSRARAVGYWQFIRSTGLRYGLKINYSVDERRDPLLSTSAAGKYLKDLYDLFGSWYLAMSAYNAGEHRVNGAMMRHYTRDFWKLRAKKSLPRETAEYVPKFMAAVLIANNPEKYGFTDLDYQEPISFDSIAISQPVSLKKLAKNLSVSYKTMRALNPKYIHSYVPLEKTGSTILRFPKEVSHKVTQELVVQSAATKPKHLTQSYVRYKVKWGDTLYDLAKRYRTTVNTIRRMNRMSPQQTLRAGRFIRLPLRYAQQSLRTQKVQVKTKKHTVKAGENLNSIAQKYKIQTQNLMQWNQLTSPIIHPGQILVVTPSKRQVHVVKKGETLSSIAKLYKVTLARLMKANGMTFKTILKIGYQLRIPSSQKPST